MADAPAAPPAEGGAPPAGGAASPPPSGPVLAAGDPGTPPAPAPAETPPIEGGEPPKEGDKPAETVPFDGGKLTLPEGFSIPEPAMAKFSETAKKFGISQEAAQQLVNLQAEVLKEGATRQQADWAKTQETWISAIKADPEVGGAKFDANVAAVRKVVEQYGDQAFKDALNQTGAGNNPAVFKTFVKIAQVLTEGSAVRGAPPAQPAQGGGGLEGMAARMYPGMKP